MPDTTMAREPIIDLDAQRRASSGRWKFNRTYTITGQDGSPYLIRRTLLETPWFALMHHTFLRSDADRCCHDHPWGFVSLILSGGYWEETELPSGHRSLDWRRPGSVLFRRAAHRHRVLLADMTGVPVGYAGDGFEDYPPTPSTSLVLRLAKRREWGFWTRHGWRVWTDFIDRKNAGQDQC